MPEHKSSDYKESAVQYYLTHDNGKEETCRIFQCSPRSLTRWVKKYKKNGTITRKHRTYTAYKVKQLYVNYIHELLKKKPTITISEIITLVKEKYPEFDISPTQVWRIVKDNNITLKLKRVRHIPLLRFGKPINVSQQLTNFYDTIRKYSIDDIICIDETSLQSLQQRKYCYSRRGTRCTVKTHSQEVFKKYTGIFAISSEGVEDWELYEKGGIDSDRLEAFLTKKLLAKRKKLIILDNASSHRNEKIREIVNKHNELLYTVPYQHFTNAIEGFFNMLKSRLQKKEGLKYEDLKRNIESVCNSIESETLKGLFEGAYNRKHYKPRKTRKQKKKVYISG
jgi:transposase